MRVVFTGQSGVNKKEYLSQLKEIVESEGRTIEIYCVGDMMEKEARDEIHADRILHLPLTELRSLRRSVFKEIITDSKEKENCILDTHAVFRWKGGLFPAFDLDQLREFKPDMFVTLIDDVDEIRDRLHSKVETEGWQGLTLKDIMVWREEEIVVTGIIAQFLSEEQRKEKWKKISHYVFARGHSPNVLHKLIFREDLKKVYASFPITGISEKLEQKVRGYRKLITEHFIVFDPYKITEREIKLEMKNLRDETQSYLEKAGDHFENCLEIVEAEIRKKEAETGEEKIWKIPSGEEIPSLLANHVTFNLKRDRKQREDMRTGELETMAREFNVSEVTQIENDVDGQIILRDFSLIDQSDFIIAYIPIDEKTGGPRISAGVQTELTYAHNRAKEVYVICEQMEKLSPWVTRMTTMVFTNLDELLRHLGIST